MGGLLDGEPAVKTLVPHIFFLVPVNQYNFVISVVLWLLSFSAYRQKGDKVKGTNLAVN